MGNGISNPKRRWSDHMFTVQTSIPTERPSGSLEAMGLCGYWTASRPVQSSVHTSLFGKEIAFSDADQDGLLDMWISAPDGGVSFQGWVGLYLNGQDQPIQEWLGDRSSDRFGFSLLSQDQFAYAGAPNAQRSYIQRLEHP